MATRPFTQLSSRFALMAIAILISIGALPLTATAQAWSTPDTMASVGDSISARPISSHSWSTGTSLSVNSIHLRIEAASGTSVAASQKARRGADSRHLSQQVAAAISSKADFITIMMGANDICGPTLADITPESTFRERYAKALDAAQAAGITVAAVSIPNIYGLWEVGKESLRARTVWDAYDICQNALADPLSTSADATARRAVIKQQTERFNAIIREECGLRANCADDGGAVYAIPPRLDDLTIDYFHPNLTGQAKIAAAVWPSVVALYPQFAGYVAPPVTDTTSSFLPRTVSFTWPTRRDVGIRKIDLTVDGRIVTFDVAYGGYGKYTVTADSSKLPSTGVRLFSVKAYDSSGSLVYSGRLPLTVRGS